LVLVDTSVWVNFLRSGNSALEKLLDEGLVHIHDFITGELACGNLHNRQEILSTLALLPHLSQASHKEVLHLIEIEKLMGKGLSYVDLHLIASAQIATIPIWTMDAKFDRVNKSLGLKYQSGTLF
jgi:predicted nucleic acid-binding protein